MFGRARIPLAALLVMSRISVRPLTGAVRACCLHPRIRRGMFKASPPNLGVWHILVWHPDPSIATSQSRSSSCLLSSKKQEASSGFVEVLGSQRQSLHNANARKSLAVPRIAVSQSRSYCLLSSKKQEASSVFIEGPASWRQFLHTANAETTLASPVIADSRCSNSYLLSSKKQGT
jgi:hypothetical protein